MPFASSTIGLLPISSVPSMIPVPYLTVQSLFTFRGPFNLIHLLVYKSSSHMFPRAGN